jgi:hypothetical protein
LFELSNFKQITREHKKTNWWKQGNLLLLANPLDEQVLNNDNISLSYVSSILQKDTLENVFKSIIMLEVQSNVEQFSFFMINY